MEKKTKENQQDFISTHYRKKKKRKLTFDDWMGVIIGFGIASIALSFIKIYFQLGFLPVFLMYSTSFLIVRTISKRIRKKRKNERKN